MKQYQNDAIAMMRRLAPPMKSVSDDVLLAWVELAEMLIACESKFGDDFYKALALFALHMMLAGGAYKGDDEDIDSYSTRLTSYTLSGEFSQTFAAVSESSSLSGWLASTPWGNMYRMMLRKAGGGFGLMVGGGQSRGCCR